MEQFENYSIDPASDRSRGIGADEFPEFLDAEQETAEPGSNAEDAAAESPFTDDPVRVYLREMGSGSLLTRSGEIGLARLMELGKLRMGKGISRSLVTWEC